MIVEEVQKQLGWSMKKWSPFLYESYTCLSAPNDHVPNQLAWSHDRSAYSFTHFLRVDDTLVDYLVKLLRKGYQYRSLYRVYFDDQQIAPKTIRITMFFRYTWFRYRFMLLIANRTLPMDIIRHVFTFVKKS
jgi:hypothetical protein